MRIYHGGPITPETCAAKVWRARCAFVSFAHPSQISVAAALCSSFALDNGAFSLWRAGKPTDWPAYYDWCEQWLAHPSCDWAVIPDVIDGDEQANDDLLADWPFRDRGVPVWHMHESIGRLERLCASYERVAIGSSGQYATVGDARWWHRMAEALDATDGVGTQEANEARARVLALLRQPEAAPEGWQPIDQCKVGGTYLFGGYRPLCEGAPEVFDWCVGSVIFTEPGPSFYMAGSREPNGSSWDRFPIQFFHDVPSHPRAAAPSPTPTTGEAVPYLANGMRFKLAATRSGMAAEFRSFPAELAGQWVALVDATNGQHLNAPPARPAKPTPAPTGDEADCSELIREYREREKKANENAGDAEEDAYHIGTRDGFHDAVQLFDCATGGDGEFFGSSEPGGTVDVPVMIRRIVARLSRPNASAEPSGLPDYFPAAARLALELECLLLSCNDTAAVSKWWGSAHEALDQWRNVTRSVEDEREYAKAWASVRSDAIAHADEGKKG